MKLHPITVSHLQYLETGQFIIRFFNDFNGTGLSAATDSDFNDLFIDLQQQSPIYDSALMQIRAKAESELLAQQDDSRDKKVITLRRAVSVFEYTDNNSEKVAYKAIKIVLNTYKDIDKANFEAESLGIDNLINELRNAQHLPHLQTLQIENHVNNLETANNIFKTTFDTRSINTINTTVYDAKLLRKNILATYKDIAEYILVMAKRKNTSYYIDILTAINNGRKYYADILARRNGNTSSSSTTSIP